MSNMATETTKPNIRQDRVARISLGSAIALNLILFALVLLANQQLSDAIAGAPDVGRPPNAYVLPVIGLVAWLVGGALGAIFFIARDEAAIAYIIWGSTVLIQLATWVPALALLINP